MALGPTKHNSTRWQGVCEEWLVGCECDGACNAHARPWRLHVVLSDAYADTATVGAYARVFVTHRRVIHKGQSITHGHMHKACTQKGNGNVSVT